MGFVLGMETTSFFAFMRFANCKKDTVYSPVIPNFLFGIKTPKLLLFLLIFD
jgi:hypothetical protein